MSKAEGGTRTNVHYRSATDVCLAAMNPTMHATLETFAIYTSCPQSAAEFAVMTIRYFKDRLTMVHWAGTGNGGYSLQQWFPVLSKKNGHDSQWNAWYASRAKNPWYDPFPRTNGVLLVPVIPEFSHERSQGSALTRLGILFTTGLSGISTSTTPNRRRRSFTTSSPTAYRRQAARARSCVPRSPGRAWG